MSHARRIAIVSPSSTTPLVELAIGADRLRAEGFEVEVHPQCAEQHFTFAGTDERRAEALWEVAVDERVDVVWAGRGGYGATRLLPLLDRLTERHGPPPAKLLVGYSDITALHVYAAARWGWATLHASMPASLSFNAMPADQWDATVALVRGERPADGLPFEQRALSFLTDAPAAPIAGPLVGGNVAVWCYLMGTPYAPAAPAGRLMFFEEVNEEPYRIDGMINQIEQAGGFAGAAGVVLGDFTDCADDVGLRLAQRPADDELPKVIEDPSRAERIPLRPKVDEAAAMGVIFAQRLARLNAAVAWKVPVGHGPNYAPLPLHADYELTPAGRLTLKHWAWLDR